MNKIIENELRSRLRIAKENEPFIPEDLKPLLEYYEKQPLDAVVNFLVSNLTEAFSHWSNEEKVQAFGFEWYYDGREFPQVLGYGYANLKKKPVLENKVSTSGSVRNDFNGAVKFGTNVFVDNTGFDVARACYPLYECEQANLCDEDDDVWDYFHNIFTLRMFLGMHLALKHIVSTDVINKFSTSPFYIFANNHDWSPFILYAESTPLIEAEEFLVKDCSLEIQELKEWLEGIKQITVDRENREKALSSIRDFDPKKMQSFLIGLPEYQMDSGLIQLSEEEWIVNCRSKLSERSFLGEVSFESVYHLFNLLVTSSTEPNLYRLSDALVFIFIKDSAEAQKRVLDLYTQQPDKIDFIKDAAKNTLRWANDRPDIRNPNPIFALSKDKLAQEFMDGVTGEAYLEDLQASKEKQQRRKRLDKQLRHLEAEFEKAKEGDIDEYIEYSEALVKEDIDVKFVSNTLANYTTKLLLKCLQDGDFEKAEQVLDSYLDKLLPIIGVTEKDSDVASFGIVFAVMSKKQEIGRKVLDSILGADFSMGSLDNEVLLFNMSCYYAVNREKQSLLAAIKQALIKGKKPEQFTSDKDFEFYWKDQDFIALMNNQ